MLIEAVGLGLLVGILYYSVVGLLPGGLIVPGYIALYLHSPLRIFATMISSLVTFYFVRHVVYNFVILYGRRRFLAMVLVGFIVKWLSDQLFIFFPFTDFFPGTVEVRVIGYIITGLIANSFAEQGIFPTIYSILIVSVIVRLLLMLFLF